MPAIAGIAPTKALRSTSHSKYSSTATSSGTSQRTGGTMRSTAASGQPTCFSAHAATSGLNSANVSSLSCDVAFRPFSQAMMFSGFSSPAAMRAASPLAMAGATNLRMRRPTAVVMRSAPAISATAASLPEWTAQMSVMTMSRLTVSVTWTVYCFRLLIWSSRSATTSANTTWYPAWASTAPMNPRPMFPAPN